MKDITTKEAVKDLKSLVEEYKDCSVEGLNMLVDVEFDEERCRNLEKVLNELEKKDRIIDAMAEEIADHTKSCPLKIYGKGMDCDTRCDTDIEKDCWKLYFEQEVKDE